MTQRRFVSVYVIDPDLNVPVEDAVLFYLPSKLTDSTDQELYLELGIGEKLKEHNEKRVKILDKEASRKEGRDVFLSPIKIRDLHMRVVTL